MLNQEEHKGWNSAKQHKNSTTTPGEYNTSHVYTALPEAVISEAAHKLRNFEGGILLSLRIWNAFVHTGRRFREKVFQHLAIHV